jgi:uncharacterized protein
MGWEADQMTKLFTSEWERYGLIAELAQKLGGTGRLGKKAIQKYVYLLQELEGVATGYKFSFYTYGPYSSDLAGDLDVVNSLQGVSITYSPSDNAYNIAQGEKTDELKSRSVAYLQKASAGIEKLVRCFGGRYAKDLELISTIVFLNRNDQQISAINEAAVVRKVLELKPKYSVDQVRNALAELRQLEYLPAS